MPFESAELPLREYICLDSDKKPIIVRVPVAEHHTPHDLQKDPAIHDNIGYAIRNYDEKRLGSDGVGSIADTTGSRAVYVCDDFYEKIDHPKKYTPPHYSMIVPVHYGDDGNNYTLTYYDKPKRI